MVSLSAVTPAPRTRSAFRAPTRIETARLLLRRPLTNDAEAVFARYAADPDVTKYLGWRTHRTVADTRLFLACCDAEWQEYGVGPYLVKLRQNGKLLGSAALHLTSPQHAGTGYVMARDAWGHGYATESLRAMRDLAFRLGVTRMSAVCHPEHRPSWRVLEKCAFTRDGIVAAHAQFPNLDPHTAADVVSYSYVFEPDGKPPAP